MRTSTILFAALLLLPLAVPELSAQTSAPSDGVSVPNSPPPAPDAPSLWAQEFLTGDWGGARTQLTNQGVTFGLNDIQEVLGNPTGGTRQGVIEEGRIDLSLDLDFQALAGLKGGSFHTNAYYIYGNGLSGKDLGKNILTVSNVEAYDTLRLSDLWYQQTFLDGKVSLLLGQLAVDDEFVISDDAANFINATFGWPNQIAANLPGGGPAYPLAAPALRLMLTPVPQFTLMAAVFSGDPGETFGTANLQKLDSSGTRIDFGDGVFAIGEAAYKWNQEDGVKGLPGTAKLGGWYASQQYPGVGPGSTSDSTAGGGEPRAYSGNWGVYGIVDQLVWRKPSPAPDPKAVANPAASASNTGLGVFCRMMGSPADRNTVSFYTDGGLNYTGLFPGRDQDIAGLAVAYAKISDDLSAAERESNAASGMDAPVQDYEIALEATYVAQLAPWWTVQPDLQYIIHPGGNVDNPAEPSGTSPIPNAVVLGLRTTVTF